MASTVGVGIDSNKAKELAIRFLEQHFSVIGIKETVLQGDIWIVTALLSFSDDRIRKVRIDTKTGRIIDWSK